MNIIHAMLLIGHILSDFYFIVNEQKNDKKNRYKYILINEIIYTACIVIACLITIQLSSIILWLIICIELSHLLINIVFKAILDIIKRYYVIKPLLIDQILHISLIWLIYMFFGNRLTEYGYINKTFTFIPSIPIVVIILGLLILLKPIGMLISSNELWDFSKNTPGESQKGAGKMIGYIERCILYILLLNYQYEAVGFIIAAKSLIRFPEINNSVKKNYANIQYEITTTQNERTINSLAEYYLIGTMLSMVSVFAVRLLCT